ncbi:HTH-type transcriptional repressor of iron proteins A [Corynebacterium faecale]|uniref:helix-turn-helix transcriptional regulator n=1 Tax=Corynebacterium faecale TaxID=1758466 RepID=UPI0025B53DEC|nr:AraC family transcriptional regulator [Corynebacterium faecale]WJY91716.1 HTH-type transcriptional repressor of iron proteins A [Corynebacterium faecale]
MNQACLLWCHSGASEVYIGERSFTLVAGDLLFAPEGAVWNPSGAGVILDLSFRAVSITGPARRIHVGQAWAEHMVYEYSRSLFGEREMRGDVAKLFEDRVPTPPLPAPKHARAVAQTLAANPADQTSLEEFAALRGVAARTLQRQFLKSTGYSFSEWRAAQRVSVAASLLAHDFSIAVVANLVGFAATSSLTRAFRRHTNATPSSFTTSSIGMGSAGLPPAIPARTTFAEAQRDQQLWIYSGTATVTTPGYCRFLAQGDMATIPAGTHTRIDVAAGSIAIPVPVGVGEQGMSLRDIVCDAPVAGLTILEQGRWSSLSEELLNTPIPVVL